jgi:hypothetical protein
MNHIIPFEEMKGMADAIAKSKLFGMQTPEQVLALMAIAQAEGLHPAMAARDYHIIQGRPALKADAMLARFQSAGGTNANGTLITLSEDTYRFDQQEQRAAQYPKEVNTREFDDEDVPF